MAALPDVAPADKIAVRIIAKHGMRLRRENVFARARAKKRVPAIYRIRFRVVRFSSDVHDGSGCRGLSSVEDK